MTTKKRKLPAFASDKEEREFWGKHTVEEYASELDELDVRIQPARTEQIAVRLYKDDLDSLRELAKRKGVGHTTLARSILEQWIARVRDKVPSAIRRARRAG
jgi:hypothetical protein